MLVLDIQRAFMFYLRDNYLAHFIITKAVLKKKSEPAVAVALLCFVCLVFLFSMFKLTFIASWDIVVLRHL